VIMPPEAGKPRRIKIGQKLLHFFFITIKAYLSFGLC
jgi:hypothetical protein